MKVKLLKRLRSNARKSLYIKSLCTGFMGRILEFEYSFKPFGEELWIPGVVPGCHYVFDVESIYVKAERIYIREYLKLKKRKK